MEARMPMRQVLILLFCFFLTGLDAQVIDKAFVDNWIRACDPKVPMDSVEAYYIDGEIYYGSDVATLNARLSELTFSGIRCIWYSRIKEDNYVPGKGSIEVMIVKGLDGQRVKGWLEHGITLFNDLYESTSQPVLTNSKDPVLVIDGRIIHHALARDTIGAINSDNIYDISVVEFFPAPETIYGANSKNGLVQIWTKKKKLKKRKNALKSN